MEDSLRKYILDYYSHLMNPDEKKAHLHIIYHNKAGDNDKMLALMKERGWIDKLGNKNVDNLLRNGTEVFFDTVAQRIYKECNTEIFINTCPKCTKLARTPFAKQCRFCSHNWH